jgi:hypothetical protein
MLNKKEFEAFRKETEKAMEEIAKKYNVNIKAGKIKYTTDSFNLDLQVSKKEVNGKSFEQSEFERYCDLYGFDAEDFGKKFTTGRGKTFILDGFKTSARIMPVLATCVEDGKRYKFQTDIKKLLQA